MVGGHFVLCDSGCFLSRKVLVPFRTMRYHLKDFRGGPMSRPDTIYELFNLRHSSKRASRVECAIGLLKSRFRILTLGLEGEITTVTLQTKACVALHNYIQRRCGKQDIFTSMGKLAIAEHSRQVRLHPRYADLVREEGVAEQGTVYTSAEKWREDLVLKLKRDQELYQMAVLEVEACLDADDVKTIGEDEVTVEEINTLAPNETCYPAVQHIRSKRFPAN